jgi:hypothetical protein
MRTAADDRPPRFQRVTAPDKGEPEELIQLINQRVGRCLERQGLLEQDTGSVWLDLDPAEDTDATPDKAGWALPLIQGSSISYRIAVGPQQGRKAFMIRTIRPLDRPDHGLERVAKANGFSLHAGVSCEGHQKEKREVRAAFRCVGIFPALPWRFPATRFFIPQDSSVGELNRLTATTAGPVLPPQQKENIP